MAEGYGQRVSGFTQALESKDETPRLPDKARQRTTQTHAHPHTYTCSLWDKNSMSLSQPSEALGVAHTMT